MRFAAVAGPCATVDILAGRFSIIAAACRDSLLAARPGTAPDTDHTSMSTSHDTGRVTAMRRYALAFVMGAALAGSAVAYFSLAPGQRPGGGAGDGPDHPASHVAAQTEPPPPAALMPADATASGMTLPDGFHATAFAHEPDVTQPIAMAFDHRGRLWVVEGHAYPEWSPTAHTDRVLIFEDRDGDGRFDERKVFLDGGTNLTGIAIGHGGVWLCAAPYLLFVPDADGDDTPDGPPVVQLDGWAAGKHAIFHGLRWGPDGWLYGEQGINAFSAVGRPGAFGGERVAFDTGIWRYHPVTHAFEVVARGMTNPWGYDFDDHGQLFVGNTVIDHLWYLLPGAIVERWRGQDVNPHAYAYMKSCVAHKHGRRTDAATGEVIDEGGHAHTGAMIYLGDNWPDAYRGHVYLLNLQGRLIVRDVLQRRASGYLATHGDVTARVPDPWFRGLNMMYGPDGGVFVIDWSETGGCHDGKSRDTGRVYKIVHGEPAKLDAFDISTMSDARLIELQSHRNEWWGRRARLALQERAASGRLHDGTRDTLKAMALGDGAARMRLRALWCLHVTGGVDEATTRAMLGDDDEQLRAWAVRLAFEDGEVSSAVYAAVERMAATDNGFVRLHIASSMRRMPAERRWSVARAMATRDDSDDLNLTLMTWYAIEPLVAADHTRAAGLLAQIKTSKLRQLVVRRIADE
ncbi:MAG: hypothetical protein GC159_10590 [Phycisphaera sp.]|nr:hypothetical protein [Phycisphaera sp.]